MVGCNPAAVTGSLETVRTAAGGILRMIRLNVPPTAKPRMTHSDKWKQRPVVLRYREFKDKINIEANLAGFRIGDAFRVIFLISMPQSWSKCKRQDMNGQPHQQKPDTDNLTKAVKDALINEDSTVWNEHAMKFWTDGPGCILIENLSHDEIDIHKKCMELNNAHTNPQHPIVTRRPKLVT